MPLRPYRNSSTVFQAYLPCLDANKSEVSIDLVSYESNYYRCPSRWCASPFGWDSPVKFRQVYLRYQDSPNHTTTFDIDDSGIIENGFTRSDVYPKNLTGNTFTVTNANPVCVKTYSEKQGNSRFKVTFAQWLGLDWVHLDSDHFPFYELIPRIDEEVLIPKGLNWAIPIDAPSRGRLWIRHFRLPKSTWVVRIYRVVWERSKVRLRLEVFQLRSSHFQNGLDEWKAYDVEVSDFLVHSVSYHDLS